MKGHSTSILLNILILDSLDTLQNKCMLMIFVDSKYFKINSIERFSYLDPKYTWSSKWKWVIRDSPPDNLWARGAFIGGGRVYMQKQHSQLWYSSWNWSCCGLTSIIFIVLSTVSLQFQDQFVPISLRPLLRTVAAYVRATV